MNRNIIGCLLCLLMLLCSCQIAPSKKIAENNEDLFIYQITYGEHSYKSVKAIALVKEKVYHLVNDSLNMTYKSLPVNAKEVKNEELRTLLNQIALKKFTKTIDYNDCDCKVITKTEYIIRYIKENKERQFVFSEVLECDKNSPCLFLEDLNKYFNKL